MNNKGFTLIEVIIAMSIFVTIIGIGYNTINKMNVATVDQQIITNGQMNANLVNQYLTKDLEQCTELIQPNDMNLSKYNHVIKTSNDTITYTIKKYIKNKKQYYDLTREENGASIDIITGQQRQDEHPFIISKDNVNENIYDVTLSYSENKAYKEYNFDVLPRIAVATGEVVQKPSGDLSQDEDFKDNKNNFFKFGYESLGGDSNLDRIWTDSGPKGNSANNTGEDSKDVSSDKEEHSIYLYINTDSANGKAETIMNMNEGDDELKSKFQNNGVLKKEQNRIKITLYGDIILEGSIKVTYKKGNTSYTKEIPLESSSKIYDIDETYEYKDGKKTTTLSQANIVLDGRIKKTQANSNYGELIIKVGNK